MRPSRKAAATNDQNKASRLKGELQEQCEYRNFAWLRADYTLVDKVDDVLRGGAGKKNLGDAGLFHGGKIGFRYNAANEHGDIVHAFLVEQLHELRTNGFVCA